MALIIILAFFLLILILACSDSEEDKAMLDENYRKEHGYKWFVGSFENTLRNTIYTIAFIAKDEEQLIKKIRNFTTGSNWQYDGMIPVQEVKEDDLWRVKNAAMKI